MSLTWNSSKHKQRRLGGEIGGDLRDRLGRAGATLAFDAGVHVEHEGVEMHAPLVGDRRRREKQIHQHRFAAPDRTPQIDAPRRLGRRAIAEHEARQQSAPRRAGRLIPEQRVVQKLQAGDGAKLRRVGADRALSGALAIERNRTSAHRRERPLPPAGSAEKSSGIGARRGSNDSAARDAVARGPRLRSIQPGRETQCRTQVYSAGTGTAAVRRRLPRALPANSRLASHSPATTTSTRSACPESISIP